MKISETFGRRPRKSQPENPLTHLAIGHRRQQMDSDWLIVFCPAAAQQRRQELLSDITCPSWLRQDLEQTKSPCDAEPQHRHRDYPNTRGDEELDMKVSDTFGSSYLTAADVTQPVIVTITGAVAHTFPGETKPKLIVSFAELPKQLVCNATNRNTIVALHGDVSEHWPGKQLVLFATTTEFSGKTVPCVRVRPAQDPPAQPQSTVAQPPVPQPVPQSPAMQQSAQFQQPAPPQPQVQAPPSDVPFDA